MSSYIAELQIVVDTKQLEHANKVLDDLSKVSPKVERTMGGVGQSFKDAGDGSDEFSSAQQRLIARVEKLTATVGESRAGVLRYDANLLKIGSTLDPLINKFDTLSTAQKDQDAVSKAIAKSQESLSTAQYKMIESLREEIALFGKSKDEILIYKASLLGVGDQVTALVGDLNKLKQAKQEEASAGVADSDSRLTKREKERAALAAQAKEIENMLALEREARRVASESAGTGGFIGGVETKEAEAALGRYTQLLDDVKAKQRELDASTDAMGDEFATLKNSIDPTSRALDDVALKQERLNTIYKSGKLAIPEQEYQRLNGLLDATRSRLEGVGVSASGAVSDFEKLKGSIDPASAAMAKLEAQQNELNAAFKNPNIKLAQGEYNRLNGIIEGNRKRLQDLSAQSGKTAKEINFAMRGLPAQFTDIFVSLQGGQAPLTVFLQQGGQLKDMFGGVGPAFRAMGGYIAGLISPLTIAATAIGVLGVAYFQGSKEADRYRLSLVSTGNAAGTTVAALSHMAAAVGETTGSVGKASEVLAMLANNTGILVSSFQKTTETIVGWSSASGVAVKDLVDEFSKLSKEPVKAAEELNKKYNFLTADIYNQIRALEEQGRTQEAAKVATNALADALASRTSEMVSNLGYVEEAWKNVKGAVTGAWDAIKGVGRAADSQLSSEIGLLEEKLRLLQEGGVKGDRIVNPEEVKALQGQIDALKEIKKENEDFAAREAEQKGQRAKNLQEGTDSVNRLGAAYIASRSAVERLGKELKTLDADFKKAKEQGLVTQKVEIEYQKSRLGLLGKISEAEKSALKKRTPKELVVREDAATRLLATLQQQGAVLSEQLNTTAKIGTEKAKFLKLSKELDSIEEKQKTESLTKDQQSLLLNREKLLSQQQANADAEKELQTRREMLKVATIQASVQQKVDADRRKYADALLGAGKSDKEASRLRERNKLEEDYQKRTDEIRKQRIAGNFEDDAAFNQALEAERSGYQTRLSDLSQFYKDQEAMQSDWSNGAKRAWANWSEESRNVAGMTESIFSSAFGSMEDALVGFVTTGKLSMKDLTVSILSDLARMATRIAANQILMGIIGSIGGAFAGGATSAGSTQAGYTGSAYSSWVATQADGGGWNGGTQFFAKGGAFTNSVVKSPTAFGTSSGLGVMGEAGPEAIMPLTRTADGQLGVQAAGGGTSSVVAPVNVTINTESGNSAGGSDNNTESQGRAVQMAVKAETEKAIQNGLRPGGSIWRALNGR
jgi:lambda family phage tail tape measure protein